MGPDYLLRCTVDLLDNLYCIPSLSFCTVRFRELDLNISEFQLTLLSFLGISSAEGASSSSNIATLRGKRSAKSFLFFPDKSSFFIQPMPCFIGKYNN